MPNTTWAKNPDGTPKKWNKKLRAFFEAYAGDARMNATEAARMAGYRAAQQTGYRIGKAFPELIQKYESKFRDSLTMGAKEVDERLAAIARDPKHKDHFKALEALARIHGRFNDKLNLTVDRATLNRQIDDLVASMSAARLAQSKSLDRSGRSAEHVES